MTRRTDFHGGEGLESLLQGVWSDGRLFGILNGCEYPKQDRRKPGWRRLLETIGAELAVWQSKDQARAALLEIAASRLDALPSRRPRHLLTSIGRLTRQKVALFIEPVGDDLTALDGILEDIGSTGVFVMLGSGDAELERVVAATSQRHDNFLFLPGYSEDVLRPPLQGRRPVPDAVQLRTLRDQPDACDARRAAVRRARRGRS